MHRQRQSRTSTSKFRQNFRELIRLSLILATHMLTLPSGRQKQKILLQDSLRTSRNTRATSLEKHLLQQVRRSKIQKYQKYQLCKITAGCPAYTGQPAVCYADESRSACFRAATAKLRNSWWMHPRSFWYHVHIKQGGGNNADNIYNDHN